MAHRFLGIRWRLFDASHRETGYSRVGVNPKHHSSYMSTSDIDWGEVLRDPEFKRFIDFCRVKTIRGGVSAHYGRYFG